ncbi:MAG: ATP-binding cassette domain-containing protein [Candidatus Thiodiazotropha sp.]
MKYRLCLSKIRLLQVRHNDELELPGLTFVSGDTLCVAGLTGSGKSSLARLLAGLEPDEQGQGLFELINPDGVPCSYAERAQLVGYIPTQPRLCFSGIRENVLGELKLSLELLGEQDHDHYSERIRVITDLLQLKQLLARKPFTLSGGESVRVALGLILIKQPQFLILDDCLHALDPEHKQEIVHILHVMAAKGDFCLIEFHSRLPVWSEQFDNLLVMGEANSQIGPPSEILETLAESSNYLVGDVISPVSSSESTLDSHYDGQVSNDPPMNVRSRFYTRGLSYIHQESQFTLGPIDLDAWSGQSIAIVGPNGAGKTTLLMCLGQLHQDYEGTITFEDQTRVITPDLRNPHRWATHVLYAFQDPDNQLYLHNVRNELADIATRTNQQDIPAKVETVARALGITAYLDDAPLDLPRAIKRLVALGAVFVANPPVLLLDEPTAELDGEQREKLGLLLQHYINKGGIAFFVSHDISFVQANATDIISLDNGVILSTQSDTLTTNTVTEMVVRYV